MTVTLDLDPALIAQAEAQAARAGTTLAQFVERLVKEEVAGAVEQSTPTGSNEAVRFIEALLAAVIHLDEHLVTFDRGFHRLLPASALTVLDPTTS